LVSSIDLNDMKWPAYLESKQMFRDATGLRLGVESVKSEWRSRKSSRGDLQRAWFQNLSQ
jgi:hypothetical protein